MEKRTTIFAIETSCDETGIAVLQKKGDEIKILSQAVASQINIHKETGGVIPEVAAREHSTVIKPLLEKVVKESGEVLDNFDAIAVTIGPGLQPALSIGVSTAQALSFAWQKPIVPIHHLEGHIYSALLNQEEDQKFIMPENPFPALALLVSGKHTMLVEMTGNLSYKIIGSTRDDAIGEAFDKVARMLDLPYPGGPEISKLAKKGNPNAYNFTPPMLNSGDLDFSYSGLKTDVMYTIRDIKGEKMTETTKSDIAASFQKAAITSLTKKTDQTIQKKEPQKYNSVLLSGGVAANELLRESFAETVKQHGIILKIAPQKLCGDNGAMIGQAAMFAYEQGRQNNWDEIDATARLDLSKFAQSNLSEI